LKTSLQNKYNFTRSKAKDGHADKDLEDARKDLWKTETRRSSVPRFIMTAVASAYNKDSRRLDAILSGDGGEYDDNEEDGSEYEEEEELSEDDAEGEGGGLLPGEIGPRDISKVLNRDENKYTLRAYKDIVKGNFDIFWAECPSHFVEQNSLFPPKVPIRSMTAPLSAVWSMYLSQEHSEKIMEIWDRDMKQLSHTQAALYFYVRKTTTDVSITLVYAWLSVLEDVSED
jgi:hypothetical protein